MLALRCRSGRQLRRQLTVLRRQLAAGPPGNDNESPAQRERRCGMGGDGGHVWRYTHGSQVLFSLESKDCEHLIDTFCYL